MYDYHVHSLFSADSDSDLDEIFKKAIQKGLKGICITDHIDYQHGHAELNFTFEPKSYFQVLREKQKQYEENLQIFIGVEMGIQSHIYEECNQLVRQNEFDYVLMSQHMVEGHDLYEKKLYRDYPMEEAIQRYYDTLKKNIVGFDDFDCLGHLDLVRRYHESAKKYDMKKFTESIEEILELLIQKEKGIEINAGGFRYGLEVPNPDWWIIKRYYEKGGRILTLGSDSHVPEGVGTEFDQVREKLKQIGFEEAMYFSKRKPYGYIL